MMNVINYSNLRQFAYSNDVLCKKIRGAVIEFDGFCGGSFFKDGNTAGEFYASKEILYVRPYNNPWSWGNAQAMSFTDEIMDVLYEKYDFGDSFPVVSTGISMGGQQALVYMVYAKRTPISCVVSCPVCDMIYHYNERYELPRGIYSAVYNEKCTLSEALEKISPIHLADRLPKAEYHIIHCDADESVNFKAHSVRMAEMLEKLGYKYTFDIEHGRGHGDLSYEMQCKFAEYVISGIENAI